jgi:MraZ protein
VIRRRIIGPAQEVEIDKLGRISVPQSLREFAGLSRDCVVLGQLEYMEIWNIDRYRSYRGSTDEEFKSSFEELESVLTLPGEDPAGFPGASGEGDL